ncbi:hypothetical protein IAT38_003349 [Cryptococcus sp. DSM 104549]
MTHSGLANRSSSAVVARARSLYASLTSSHTPLLPFVPKPLKLFLLLVFLLNAPSWPFQWHLRVCYVRYKPSILAWLQGRARWMSEWKVQNKEQGGVQGLRLKMKRVAWVDDCDYNMHLSNSCYGKCSDPLKRAWAIETFGPIFGLGADMFTGATHYNFFREIPLGTEYTMEARCGGWDEKWIFIVIEYIVYPKKTKSRSAERGSSTPESAAPPLVPIISAPPTGTSTPTPNPSGPSSSQPSAVIGGSKVEDFKKAWLKRRAEKPREDGGVVCCVAITEQCLKMGRVTIPPRIALWAALHSPSKEEQARAKEIVLSKDKGVAFLRGGWRKDENAGSLGADIGLGPEVGDAERENWARRGAEGMAKVLEGESVF